MRRALALRRKARRRERCLAAVLCLALVLGGCGGKRGGEEEKLLEFRAAVLSAQTLSLTASLRADYGDRVYDFVLSYAGGGGAGGTLTVLEPALIEGVEVDFGEHITLHYQGAQFDTGALPGTQLSPVEALPLMLEAWRGAFIADSYRERLDGCECVVAVMDLRAAEQDVIHRLWLDAQTLLPLAGELEVSGVCALTCRFSNVTIA